MIQSFLQPGDAIGLITPAGVIKESDFLQTSKNLKELDLTPYYYDSLFSSYNEYLAGTDKERAEELHQMYLNKSVKAILAVRGGYGCARMADLIDYSLIKKNPKPLIGYSDLTFLQSAIYKNTKIPSLHGITGNKLFSLYTKKIFKKYFFETNALIHIKSADPVQEICTFDKKQAKGILIGGNLSMLISLLNTPYDISWKDTIIFIEEINEPLYKVDRMLQQLIQAQKFKEVQAIIFGKFSESKKDSFVINSVYETSIKQIIYEKMYPLNIPCIFGFSFGHIKNQAILPFGIYTKVSFTDGSLYCLREDWQSSFNL